MKKFKKQISFLMAALLIVCTGFSNLPAKVSAEDTSSTDEMVAVASYDFEGEDTEGWGPRGTESAAVSDEVAYTGSQSAKVTDRTKTWNGIQLDCTDLLKDSVNYTFQIWVYQNQGWAQSMTLSVATTIDGTESYANLKSQNVNSGNWTLFEGSFTYSKSMEAVKVYIEGGTNDFYIDNASILTKNTTESIDSSSFESSLNGWGARGSETVALSDAQAHAGSQSAAVTDRTASWNGIQKDITSLLTDGKTYTFGVWVYYDAEDADDATTMNLSMATTLDGETSYANLVSQSVNKGEWTYFSKEFTYTASIADSVAIYIEGGTMDFYIDDATITAEKEIEIQDVQSIKDTYKGICEYMGTSVLTSELSATEKAIIAKHYNCITPGNEMKPDSTLDYNKTVAAMEETGDDTQVVISLSKAAPILEFAEEYGLAVRGHCLVWHSQTPRWFFAEDYSTDASAELVSRDVMLQRMENYIKAMFTACEEQYPNVNFYAWDVVNEAATDGSTSDGLRAGGTTANSSTSLWNYVIGSDFIEKAFEYAREYAPEGTKLAYNDYNECYSQKSTYIYNICKNLADKGLIDIVGMQQHDNMSEPTVSNFEKAIRLYDSLGVEVQITEFDMTTYDTSTSGMEAQGTRYKAIFDKLKELVAEGMNVTGCTFWGVRDTDSWRAWGNPCLFDENYEVKPAYYGVIGDTTLPTDTPATTETVATSEAPVTSETVATSETPVTSETVATSETPVTSETVATSETPVTSETVVTSETPVSTETTVSTDAYPVVSVKTSVSGSVSQTYTITRGGSGTFDVSKLAIRYYYTKDGSTAQSFWCDNAAIQMNESPYYVGYTSNVKATFGDGYVEITFDKAYDMGEGTLSVQTRFNQSDWSQYQNFVGGEVAVYYNGQEVAQ